MVGGLEVNLVFSHLPLALRLLDGGSRQGHHGGSRQGHLTVGDCAPRAALIVLAGGHLGPGQSGTRDEPGQAGVDRAGCLIGDGRLPRPPAEAADAGGRDGEAVHTTARLVRGVGGRACDQEVVDEDDQGDEVIHDRTTFLVHVCTMCVSTITHCLTSW